MRYLVIIQSVEEDIENSTGDIVQTRMDVSKVIACNETREIAKAIQEVFCKADYDWSLWEVTPKGIVQKAVRFKMDGKMAYDVEVC